MIDRPLDKYLTRKGGESGHDTDHDASAGDDAADDLGSFGWLRGVRDRALMLELRKKDGTIAALPYAYIERADFDPSHGITLYVMGKQVRIKGRNLNGEIRPHVHLFNGITRHRVPWLRQANGNAAGIASDNDTVIESIEW